METKQVKYFLPKLTWDDQKTVYAMSGEDGIVQKIFENVLPATRTFVEIGINWNGEEFAKGRKVFQGNTVALKEQGWTGWWFDGTSCDPSIIEAFITPLNINELMRVNGVPYEVDLFSLDVDGQDFWILMALALRPRVFLLEVNSHFDPGETKSTEYAPRSTWHGDSYYGASLGAFNALAIDKGYVLVYYNAANAFFIRRDLLSNPDDFRYEEIAYRTDYHKPHPRASVWVDVVTGERSTRESA